VDSGKVLQFIELDKRKYIIWGPKHPMHFNRIKKQEAWEKLGKEMNRPVDERKKKNCELSDVRK
jgi:hypothetical protein